jgi:hypothetical protein
MWQRLASRGEPTYREVFAILGVARPLAWSLGASDLWRSHAAHAHAARLALAFHSVPMGLSAPYAASFHGSRHPHQWRSRCLPGFSPSNPDPVLKPQIFLLTPIPCAYVPSLSCWVALADVAGPLRLCRWWFRPTRCAWRSFLVLVLMADGWWSRPFGAHGAPSLCCWVALAGVAGPLRMVVDGSGPLGAHVRLLAAQRPREGPVGGTVYTVSSLFGTHDAPSRVTLPGVTPRSLWVGD